MDRTRTQRQAGRPPPQRAFRFGSFELQPGRQLLRNGSVIPVGRIVLELLGALVRARGKLVTKDELFEAAWPGVVVVENALHQHMRALRNALGDHSDLIVTVARRGYRFEGQGEEIEVGDQDADASGELPSMPAPLTPLIGREDELPAIDRLLAAHRCVTLLGHGGVGKTRLAIEVARLWEGRGTGPAHWVGLAGIAEGDGVDGAIAAAFGLTGPSSLPPLARVRHVLRDNAALILLDNCEHLVDACSFAVHQLMQGHAGLHVLATSQQPLGMSGEHRVRVSMLGVPPEGTRDGGVIAASPAVKLLLARVGECASQLHIDSDALEDAAALCRQLDGNALAIELAAVHVATIGLAATRSALADHFRLLAGGPRDVLPKHRSLEAMIDWSHALLNRNQAALFRRLSVFAGGWTLEAAIAAIGDATHDPADIAGDLSELVERSLIVSEGLTRSPRLRMLEAQRFYALKELRASGEHEMYAVAHARYFVGFFEEGHDDWDDAHDEQWLARHAPERDNLRAAIRFALANSDRTLAARLVGSSVWLWRATGAAHELRQLLQHPLLQPGLLPPGDVRARLELALAFSLHWTSSESLRVESAAAGAVAAFEGSSDMLGAADSLLCLAAAFAQLGDTLSHQTCLGRIESLLGEHRHGKTYGWYCGSHAWAAQLAGDLHAALAWATRSRIAYRGSGARHGETRALLHLADLQLAAGDAVQAIALGEECIAMLEGGLHRVDLGRAHANLAAARFATGDVDRARSDWERALGELRGLDFSYWVFDHLALLAISRGHDDAAARMIGFADAGYARLSKGKRVQNEQRAHDAAMARLRGRFPAYELAALLLSGAVSSEEEMSALALLV